MRPKYEININQEYSFVPTILKITYVLVNVGVDIRNVRIFIKIYDSNSSAVDSQYENMLTYV